MRAPRVAARSGVMRGSSPGRNRNTAQRDFADRAHDFQAGHKKLGGRQKGTPNFFSADLKKALCEAADRIGYDVNGKGCCICYFVWVAMNHHRVLAGELLARMLHRDDAPDE